MARAKSGGGAPAPDVEVQVVSPLKRGGKRHEPEAMVTLPADEAAALIAAGVVRSKADAEALWAGQAEAASADDVSKSS